MGGPTALVFHSLFSAAAIMAEVCRMLSIVAWRAGGLLPWDSVAAVGQLRSWPRRCFCAAHGVQDALQGHHLVAVLCGLPMQLCQAAALRRCECMAAVA